MFIRDDGHGDVRIALLDLEKCRRRWRWGKAAQRDMDQLRRHRGGMPQEDWQHLQQLYAQYIARPEGRLNDGR